MEVFEKIEKIFPDWTTLADLLGIPRSRVYMWRCRGVIPQRYCADIVALSDGQLTLHELRPDVFPLQRVA